TVRKFGRGELEDILRLMGTTEDFGLILRAKGIVQCDDGSWVEFDMVPEELEIRECRPDYIGRICVIGTEIDENALKETLKLD
ncbi:MAG: GTP-binding protein, partial [Anaerovoracaceae bacterium]|nr:GTP-binding protein [Anaerovoracaceae bacterium]